MKQLKTFLLLLLLTAGTTTMLAQDNTESDDGISLAFTIVGEAIEDGFNHSDGILIEWLDADGMIYDEYDIYLPQATDTLQLASDELQDIAGLCFHVYVHEGYTFKVFFNGKEMTGFAFDEEEADNSYIAEFMGDEYFVDNGSWQIVIMKSSSAADINNDGHVTIADVTKLVNIILGKE